MKSLLDLLMSQTDWLVLTGAGISSLSGIPTYRNSEGKWQRKSPVTYQEFLLNETSRRQFWARNIAGWRFISAAEPNIAHLALVKLEKMGMISGLVTQNVDGLHEKAGSKGVIDLHGRADSVLCLDCGDMQSRQSLQDLFKKHNPIFFNKVERIVPENDASIDNLDFTSLIIPSCHLCGGLLKPDVVFFGEVVPHSKIDLCMDMMKVSSGLLVVGSSLQVFSGYRFCNWASKQGKPIALLCNGDTRADHLAIEKTRADCGPVLRHWMQLSNERIYSDEIGKLN
ncbi:MAG: NAD-dependent deacetylase [Cellvibrionales bacterium TMED49]|nr:NAD-dependent deacetylase [Porticoccaceae bacterium]OUU38319.1 MAG: NAD-dependent deacetylase [Cellvibrionales bacterium TMED49]